MANARKPTALHVLEGTQRKDRANPHEPKFMPTEEADAPDWLAGPEAVNEWYRLRDILEDQRILTAADTTALGHACNYHAKMVEKWRLGAAPTAAELTQFRMMYREFGLTPASRAGVSGGEKDKANPFGELTG